MVTKKGAAVSALGPGQSARLVLVATTQDGKQLATVGAGNGKVAFDNYTIDATIVAVSRRGALSLSADPRVSEGKVAHLHISVTTHPEVVTDLDVPVRYDIPFVANYPGADGSSGLDGLAGSDGLAGTDGTPASVDPTTGALGNPGQGGDGTPGGNGGDGGNGQDGSPPAPLHVWVRLEPGAKPLLQIKVSNGRKDSLYLVDPNGGSLKVVATGGAGGRGGMGGRGGRGGSGGSGFPQGVDGTAGLNGWDGHSGSGGAGGKITISVDPAAQPF
ncbi:MAG TPA: hypothetical protein VGC34_11675, partial [Steroidobacteraceae bacterium]